MMEKEEDDEIVHRVNNNVMKQSGSSHLFDPLEFCFQSRQEGKEVFHLPS